MQSDMCRVVTRARVIGAGGDPECGAVDSNLRSPRFPTSKFCAPGATSHLVHRSRLFEILDSGEQRRLTLVVGSPGAGKTMLLADWLDHRSGRPSAWLNCDEADADPVRFVSAIIEATRRGHGQPGLGEDARQLLSVDGAVSADVIAALADDLEGLSAPGVLVVNDFHLAGVQAAGPLGLLLEYRPPSLQVAVATRVDPPLRLHRMRATGDLAEVRDRELNFTLEETRALLPGFGLQLADSELTLIHERSEGWVAGLQMAAIAIQSSPDPVRAAGRVELRAHTVAGYFLDEVLYRQPTEIAEFMLATSILDELSPQACSALVGEGSAAMLDQVSSAHMFVSLVDEETRTYRYHHLIRDVLQAELHARDPGRNRQLHAKASTYLVEAGDLGGAARHLMAAGDPTAAAQLLSERLVRDFSANPTLGSALDLDRVQLDLYAGVPEILLPLSAELLLKGAFERGSRALVLAQQALSGPNRSPADQTRLAVVSSFYCFGIGELEESLAHRESIRDEEITEGWLRDWIAGLDATAMYCHTYLGQFEQARRLAGVVASRPEFGPAVPQVLCPAVMSQVAYGEGDLQEAAALCSRALDGARRLGFDRHYFAFTATRTGALLALEQRDLTTAAEFTERSLSGLVAGRPVFDFLTQLDRARLWSAAGNFEEALASLPAARAALGSERSPLLAQADEVEARLRIGIGDHDGARRLAAALREERRIVLSAIIALAAGDPAEAESVLSSAPPAGATIRSDLELRLLRATVATLRGGPRARQMVRDALVVIERHGYVQTVLDTAPRMVEHVMSDSAGYRASEHLSVLIAAGVDARKVGKSVSGPDRLADPLTEAELRVLEKLSQRLTYADMAADLFLSLNTVKTHLRHTYMKLGVTSRSAAVKRASALGLL
jgi:LuxR family transcriptional regulator, maltose regulon positive regulatory protein